MKDAGAVLRNRDIICFSHTPWQGPWKASQQIMSRLAAANRVLYVGPPVALREGLRCLMSGTTRWPAFERISDTLTVYHEPPLYARAAGARTWSGAFNRMAARLRLAQVRNFARRQGMDAPILWAFDPFAAPAIAAFRRSLVVYHVLDNYVEFYAPEALALRQAAAEREAEMLRMADLVFAVSETLCRRCAAVHHRAMVVPNGVDYERFRRAGEAGVIPDDMRHLPKPVVGYVGVLQPDIDFALLEKLADARRAWSLVFVGPEELGGDRSWLERLLRRPNVHYLGPKPVAEVPAVINACDVCLLPDRVTGYGVQEGDSLKLYEYLACGKPVVATDIPSAKRVAPWVRIAHDTPEFIRHVEEALGESKEVMRQRREAAVEHSWARRVERLSEAVHRHLRAGEDQAAEPRLQTRGRTA